MPTEIYMVKLGMTMTEGTVAEWHIPDGGEVKTGEDLYRLETEKVEMEIEAEADGIVRHLVPDESTVEPGAVVGYVYAAGEDVPETLPSAGAPVASGNAAAAPAAAPAASAPPAAPAASGGRVPASPAARRLAKEFGIELAAISASGPGGRVIEDDVRAAQTTAAAAPVAPTGTPPPPAPTSPLARKRAEALGVDVSTVQGSGPGGRITKEDVEAAAAGGGPASAPAPVPARADEALAVRGMRKVIAQRMYASLQSTAQLTMDMDVVMDDAVRLRTQLIEEWSGEGVRPSYTDIVMKAAAKALLDHPRMNAQFSDTEITLRGETHIGMAVALDEGLVVPVVRNVEQRSLKEVAVEAARLAAAAREGTLGLDDMAGGTFTVSTLGMFGVDSFTPILNPPEVGILGVNRLRDAVRWEGETPLKQKAMTLSLTWDHRALDGAPAAQFLAGVRDYLEAPFRLLV